MWTQYLQCVGFLAEVRGLSCPVECGVLVPQPGIKPVSPALESKFLTTGSPGKPIFVFYIDRNYNIEEVSLLHCRLTYMAKSTSASVLESLIRVSACIILTHTAMFTTV